jgi:hypothetical protein
MGQLVDDIERIFHDQTTVFKLSLSFGFIYNNETEQMQYHHSFANNNRVFDTSFQIRNLEDLQQVREALQNIDIHELARQQRPNSNFTNATFYVTKLRDHPIGRSVRLPKYCTCWRILPSYRSTVASKQTGLLYEDKVCFFRCLAMHKGCHPHNLERDTKNFLRTVF